MVLLSTNHWGNYSHCMLILTMDYIQVCFTVKWYLVFIVCRRLWVDFHRSIKRYVVLPCTHIQVHVYIPHCQKSIITLTKAYGYMYLTWSCNIWYWTVVKRLEYRKLSNILVDDGPSVHWACQQWPQTRMGFLPRSYNNIHYFTDTLCVVFRRVM